MAASIAAASATMQRRGIGCSCRGSASVVSRGWKQEVGRMRERRQRRGEEDVLELREPDLPRGETVQLHHVFREFVREDIVYEH